MKKNPVVHFEMPYEDKERAAKFYSAAFGWDAQMMGPEMGGYVVMHTTEMDANNMPLKVGHINGGFFKRTKPDQSPSVVVAVDDIREAMKRVTDAGGTLLGGGPDGSMEPGDIPGVGLFMSFSDSEGNRISMIQPAPMMDARAK